MDSREKYAKMAEKNNLPKLEDLEKNFSFKLSKDTENIKFDILKGVEESIIYAREVMEKLLFISESSSQSHLYEARFINRKKVFMSYKKIMELKWKYRMVYFHTKEEDCQDFIRDSFDTWKKDIKPCIMEMCEKMEDAWKNYKNTKEERQRYFG